MSQSFLGSTDLTLPHQCLDELDLISSTPESVAQTLINSIGRLVWRDASLYTYVTRLITKVVDMNLLVEGMCLGQPFMSDMKKVYAK
jgi:hypothetical protein